MRRLAVVSALACAAGCWHGEPPVVENVVSQPVASEAISGTVWRGIADGVEETWEFRPDGTLHYTTPSGTWDNGTWKQDGSHVTWETNEHYADYDGSITGTLMRGKAWNVDNHRWTWSFHRVRAARKTP